MLVLSSGEGHPMKFGKRAPWVLAILLLVLASANGQAKEAELSGESRGCLQCHGKRGIEKKFLNEETVEAYVNPEKVRTSVHNFLSCSECHSGFSPGTHPSGKYQSKSQYRLRTSSICRKRHPAEKIRGK